MRLLAAILAMLVVVTSARADEAAKPEPSDTRPLLDMAAARRVTARMDASDQVARLFKACPADTFRRETGWLAWFMGWDRKTDISEADLLEQCGKAPESCYARCLGSEGQRCFGLARTFQVHAGDVPPLYVERLFSLSCAMGDEAGCTNRAAGIRNGDYKGDPFETAAAADKQACEFRSFTVACSGKNQWGCAMLGQSYEFGEGTSKDVPRAEKLYHQTCDMRPDFAACDFAKDHLRDSAIKGGD